MRSEGGKSLDEDAGKIKINFGITKAPKTAKVSGPPALGNPHMAMMAAAPKQKTPMQQPQQPVNPMHPQQPENPSSVAAHHPGMISQQQALLQQQQAMLAMEQQKMLQ